MKKLVSAVAAAVLVAALAACSVLTLSSRAPSYAIMRAQTVNVDTLNGHGSGVIIGPRHILTARHVVEEADHIFVHISDGTTREARVVWSGGEPLDAAMLEIKAGETPLPTKPFYASCAPLHPGQTLYASGFPLTNLPQIVTSGKVVSSELFHGMQLAELSVIPGMSGGPVFNARGELVALNTAVIVMPLGVMSRSTTGVAGLQPLTPLCEAHVAGLN